MNPFTPIPSRSVAAHGEVRLITQIRRWLGPVSPAAPFGIGDDCAVLPPTKHHQLVTTDPVIYGRHFDATVPPSAVGAKLLKRNLSDIAAMGGRPVAAVISLALATDTNVAWLRAFYRGLARCAYHYGVKIVGGDLTQATPGFLGAFLMLHGESAGPRIVTRTGAQTGDAIFVTGKLGGSLAGHHYRFTPRLTEGAWLARQPGVRAMMDVSDGIAQDIRSLTPRHLVASLDPACIPTSRAAQTCARHSGRPAWVHALTDGEDYELLFVLAHHLAPEKLEARWRRKFKTPLTCLGRFSPTLTPGHIDWTRLHGYEHLR